MLVSTGVSMVTNLKRFLGGENPNYLLGGVGCVLLILGAWLVVEAVLVLFKDRRETSPDIEL